jgi:uncharacterized delta-60 repeat protein
MLLPNGQRDPTFTGFWGQGKVTPWNDQYYVRIGDTVRRLLADCLLDPSFIEMNDDPLFSALQGGDYYVYPDGRVLMSGVHVLHDTVRNYLGQYCLCWFSNTGYLDTTAHHRTCAGSLDFFSPLPNGQFIGSGSTGIWDGQTASNIIRFNADGSLDPTFQAHVWWGEAYGFLPLPDGRVYVGGNFRVEGLPDTLNLVRFMPDGLLDPSFNNTAKYRFHDLLYPGVPPWGIVRTIHPLPDGRLIVTGNFENIDEQTRGGIALIDTMGNLLEDLFTGEGCGGYYYQPNTSQPPVSYARVISGIKPAPDGNYYIWGAYNGYDDGTANDTDQRFVSRLYGLNVGIHEQAAGQVEPLQIVPNPSAGETRFALPAPVQQGELSIHDTSGRLVWQAGWPSGSSSFTLPAGALAPGTYVVRVQEGRQGSVSSGKLVILP